MNRDECIKPEEEKCRSYPIEDFESPEGVQMIGKKRASSRVRKNHEKMLNADEDTSKFLFDSSSNKSKNIKKKKNSKEYVVPQRPVSKVSELLSSIINKVITKFDPLQILRGYREKLKPFPEYNNFSLKKVEKLISPVNTISEGEALSPSVNFFLCFETNSFNLEIHKKDLVNVNMFTEMIQDKIEPLNIMPTPNIQSSNTTSIRHSDLKLINEEYQTAIEKKYENIFILPEQVDNIDILRYKVENNYYPSLNDFEFDVRNMFKIISANSDNLISDNTEHRLKVKYYLSACYVETARLIDSYKKEYQELFEKDIKAIIDSNKLPKINSTFKNIPLKKEYQTISEYEHIFPEITKAKVKTSLKPKCGGGCCENYQDLGPLNLEKGKWDSKCRDRENNIECDPEFCGCKSEECKNMAISNRIQMNLGEDVVEKYAWGIDLFTYRNLIEFLPLNFTDEFKATQYIEKTLIKSLSDLDTQGYSIIKTLKYLIKNSSESNIDLHLSQHLLNVFLASKVARENTSTSFSKGIGIFCKKESGIKQNELISIYLGEIYPPWYWYEKQDLIKKNKLDQELPDFYNIMLERLKCDDKGYDLVMVDPNSKGNFASRMSHSCMPNCNTVLMSSREEYAIGMFATKEMSYGDELTFDYNSVTEKEKEFQDAICLCSCFHCRGHYLIYSNSVLFTEVLSKHHTFLHRNAVLLHACDPKYESNIKEELLSEDLSLLRKYSVGSCVLEGAPFWLKKWTALILRYVDLEVKLLPIMLKEKSSRALDREEKEENSREKKKVLSEMMSKDSNSMSTDCISIASNIIVSKSVVKDLKTTNGPMKKFDFNASNFIYPGMKRYQSSTRRHKVEEDVQIKNKIVENVNVENLNYDIKEDVKLINEVNNLENFNNVKDETNTKDAKDETNIANNTHGQNEIKKITIKSNHYCNGVNVNHSSESVNYKTDKIITDDNALQHILANTPTSITVKPAIKDDYTYQVNGITENRIQNIAITLNKVLHVLDLMKTYEPPLVLIPEQEIYELYWGKQDSIRSSIETNIKKLFGIPELAKIKDKINLIISLVKPNSFNSNDCSEEDYCKKNNKNREIFKAISKIIKVCSLLDKSNKYVFYEGLADILFLYGSTKHAFKANKRYESSNSEKISIRRRDINTNASSLDLDSAVCTGEKTYDRLYIWGQLIGWFKQTVDKPNASLSAERRGSLSYPEIDSFFVYDYSKKSTKSRTSSIFEYPSGKRNSFFAKLIENPSMMWPVGNDWSYKNKKKIYGTVQFDSIFHLEDTANVESSNSYLLNTLKAMEETYNN